MTTDERNAVLEAAAAHLEEYARDWGCTARRAGMADYANAVEHTYREAAGHVRELKADVVAINARVMTTPLPGREAAEAFVRTVTDGTFCYSDLPRITEVSR